MQKKQSKIVIDPERPKFRKYFSPIDISKLLEIFATYGELVKVESDIRICRDLKDNFLLSLSMDSQADFLITGDNDLLELKNLGKTNILTITEFEKKTLRNLEIRRV